MPSRAAVAGGAKPQITATATDEKQGGGVAERLRAGCCEVAVFQRGEEPLAAGHHARAIDVVGVGARE